MCPQKCPFHIRAVKCYYQSTWMPLLNSQSRGPISRADGTFCFNNLTSETSTERNRNVWREGSLCFPNFEASNAWQVSHNSCEGFFLGQELLLLDFAAWINLISNANNMITVYQLPWKFQSTFWFFKTCWLFQYGFVKALWCLSTRENALNHQAGVQGTLKQCLRY